MRSLSRLFIVSMFACLMLMAAALGQAASPFEKGPPAPGEIRQYQGQSLDAFHRTYDNAVETPPQRKVDPRSYRLKVTGLVAKPLSLTYEQALALPHVKRVENLPCVEGWSERLLFEGVRIMDLVAKAGAEAKATIVIFHTAGGLYSSSLSLEYVKRADALLAFKVNGLTLNQKRGYPFQVVAPHKLGYKWVKWVSAIELSAKPYQGYWEKRGYGNAADTKR